MSEQKNNQINLWLEELKNISDELTVVIDKLPNDISKEVNEFQKELKDTLSNNKVLFDEESTKDINAFISDSRWKQGKETVLEEERKEKTKMLNVVKKLTLGLLKNKNEEINEDELGPEQLAVIEDSLARGNGILKDFKNLKEKPRLVISEQAAKTNTKSKKTSASTKEGEKGKSNQSLNHPFYIPTTRNKK